MAPGFFAIKKAARHEARRPWLVVVLEAIALAALRARRSAGGYASGEDRRRRFMLVPAPRGRRIGASPY